MAAKYRKSRSRRAVQDRCGRRGDIEAAARASETRNADLWAAYRAGRKTAAAAGPVRGRRPGRDGGAARGAERGGGEPIARGGERRAGGGLDGVSLAPPSAALEE